MSDFLNELKKRNVKSFKRYINKIRFPYFKKLKQHTEITFNFPFTVLVGPNGSGKSSTLQALYGCPNGKNVSDFWFSTSLDPIVEGSGEVNRFIYQYKPDGYNAEIEVIKTRRKRKAKGNQPEDPDYWETARPSIKDGMNSMPEYKACHAEIRSDTRWKAINKDVVYIDFRAELSSFDKFFYFGHFEKRHSIRSKQDFIRHRSKALRQHIDDNNYFPKTWHCRTTKSVVELNESELCWVNRILGKSYISAKIVTHDLYNNDGYSIIFTNSDERYTEAVAGSGEVSVVNCVVKVLRAAKDSLVLLDEPEVSLHPGAQIELRNLLLDEIKKNGHQVILSTHSEHFVDGLPNNAIKLFQYSNVDGRYEVLNECSPQQAFIRLGSRSYGKKKLYVEDELAQVLVEEAIKEIDPELLKTYCVIPYPGGAQNIINNLLVQFLIEQELNDDIVFLDGDMLRSIDKSYEDKYSERLDSGEIYLKIYSADIPISSYQKIDKILQEQIKGLATKIRLPLNGGNADNSSQEVGFKLKILDLYHNKFKFMNVKTPEELIWEIASGDMPTNIDAIKIKIFSGEYKDRFEEAASLNLGEEQVNSKTILDLQIAFLHKRNNEHPLWVDFKDLLIETLGIENIGSK
ncbi:ATP-dependent nuclease [Shewanella baltica]|uniref:ATP-dependent nuclease n=1 Tax=Shewanella baltica TaxID=62322 RepID=UPI003D7B4186